MMLVVVVLLVWIWICGKLNKTQAESFGDQCRSACNAELEKDPLNGLFDGAGGTADDAGDFLVGQSSAYGERGTKFLISK